MNEFLLILCFIGVIINTSCIKCGCTDTNALNYLSKAKKDDGSCILPSDLPKEPNKQSVFTETFTLSFGPSIWFDYHVPTFKKESGL